MVFLIIIISLFLIFITILVIHSVICEKGWSKAMMISQTHPAASIDDSLLPFSLCLSFLTFCLTVCAFSVASCLQDVHQLLVVLFTRHGTTMKEEKIEDRRSKEVVFVSSDSVTTLQPIHEQLAGQGRAGQGRMGG